MKCNNSGFSLLEILIALAILVVGVASVVNMFPVGLHAAKRGADFTMAGTLGQAKMAELIYLGYNNWSDIDSDLTGDPEVSGYSSGEKNSFPDFSGYKWHINMADDEHAIAKLAKATLWIYWNDRGTERYATFITYIADLD